MAHTHQALAPTVKDEKQSTPLSDWKALHKELKNVPANERLSFACKHIHLLKDYNHAVFIMQLFLSESERLPFVKQLPDLAIDSFSLAAMLKLLPEDKRVEFFAQHEIAAELKEFNNLNKVFNRIKAVFPAGEKRQSCFKLVSEKVKELYAVDTQPYDEKVDVQPRYIHQIHLTRVTQELVNLSYPRELVCLITQFSSIFEAKVDANAKLALNWQDLIYLHQNKIGLSCTDDEMKALAVAGEGGHYNAMSLATFGRDKHYYFVDSGLNMDFEKDRVDEAIVDKKYSPRKKQDLLSKANAGVKSFIENSFKTAFSPGFVLVDREYNALNPYDYNSEYPSGECRDYSFSADKVKAVIIRETPEWNVEIALQTLLTHIKRLVAENVAQPSPSSLN